MLKRLLLVLALAGLLSPAYGAGTIPGFSLAQQQDSDGTPLVGCKLYTIQAGTTSTPQSGYQDSALTIPLSNPIICDAFGRLPQIFLADGSIKLRLTKSNGVQVFAADGILVVGASSGGGGGSPVDATTTLATGDIKPRYGTGVLSGFVRANGRTIGSSTSGASERANADCQILFEYLWNTDVNLSVSTGRGASSAADWAANKTITLPDGRGLALAGLDDMGGSARGVFTGATFSTGDATTLGSIIGASRRTLSLTQLPTGITSANTSAIPLTALSTNFVINNTSGPASSAIGGGAVMAWAAGAFVSQLASTGTVAIGNAAVTSNNTSGAAHDTISPYMLITIYIKL